MSRRDIPKFVTEPDLTPEKVEEIKNWFVSARRNEDVATEPESNSYYEGQGDALEWVLRLLHNKLKKETDSA